MKTPNNLPAPTQETAVQTIDQAYIEKQLVRLFHALADSTGDVVTAVTVIEKVADGIEADPEFSKQILTPENISKVYALKAKSDDGSISIGDVEKAFPEMVAKIPFWNLLKTFIPKGK